ncbi:MAG: hypothetical protein KDK36_09180 [Leptospiraceae bacterium]|nr:hypothetical protein [Leptospiraceae bacterium]
MKISAINSSLPVFPFHHITKVQMASSNLKASVSDGALPQVEIHLKSRQNESVMSKSQMQDVLTKWLKAPEILRSKTGNIIDFSR